VRSISIALLTRNETTQFHWLMQALSPALSTIDEIVVVDDFSDAECVEAIRSYEATMPIRFFQRALQFDFAKQRNHMKSLCKSEYIFFCDPDELPSETVISGLQDIVAMMARLNIDACTLPRLNILYEGDQILHPHNLDLDHPRYQPHWEDQFRILRNAPEIHWTMPLNEYLTGMRRCYRFPQADRYALLHPKIISSQRWRLYQSFKWRKFHRYKNSIMKRLPWRPKVEWVSADPPF
jgi:glycosyltransferase involved in cell wall biosynthesis